MGEKTCKVFTPPAIVAYMLDKAGYVTNLQGKKVLENSCGTGRFLTEIVRRYIVDARLRGMSDEKIVDGLEKDICGIEKEDDAYAECKKNLDQTAMEFGLTDILWNIRLGDALAMTYEPEYQYVVGNPPYITYYNMQEKDRTLIRNQYAVCKKGKADYYYAFTEAAIKALAPNGIMVYLIPNNFMKNHYSEELRNFILPYLSELEDFKFERIFENRQISSAIIVCEKQYRKKDFLYIDRENASKSMISKTHLQGKWMFHALSNKSGRSRRFGDMFRVSAPVATLLNEAFVINDFAENEMWIEKDGFRLEKEGLRLAASPKSKQLKEKSYIIFPYYYENDKCCRYEEEVFTRLFPQIAAYLEQYRDRLLKRNAEKKCKWFEYGRSQALAHIDQEKIMLSTLITGRVRYYHLAKEVVPYSGMYIVPKKNNTIEQAVHILESKAFYDYITSIGIHANGKTYRISPRDVGNYILEEKW